MWDVCGRGVLFFLLFSGVFKKISREVKRTYLVDMKNQNQSKFKNGKPAQVKLESQKTNSILQNNK